MPVSTSPSKGLIRSFSDGFRPDRKRRFVALDIAPVQIRLQDQCPDRGTSESRQSRRILFRIENHSSLTFANKPAGEFKIYKPELVYNSSKKYAVRFILHSLFPDRQPYHSAYITRQSFVDMAIRCSNLNPALPWRSSPISEVTERLTAYHPERR